VASGMDALEIFPVARHQKSQERFKAAPALRLLHDLWQVVVVNHRLRRGVFLARTTRKIA